MFFQAPVMVGWDTNKSPQNTYKMTICQVFEMFCSIKFILNNSLPITKYFY